MSGKRTPGHAMPLQVRQIRHALSTEFAEHIDLGDVRAGASPEEREQVFLTRALSAKAAALLTGYAAEDAARTVIDGAHDSGIDAIAFSPTRPELWLIQAKWSDRGAARPSADTVMALLGGLNRIVNRRYEQFNSRLQPLADRIDETLASPYVRINLVLAVMGDERLVPEIEALLSSAVEEFGVMQDLLDVRVLNLADFHAAARHTIAPPISLTATFASSWHLVSMPHQTFTGLLAADDLARWYETHGDRLFERNLRGYLGVTEVNQAIMTTALDTPEHFSLYNNGITVLCDDITASYFARQAEGQPVRLELVNARVVNGAQTIASLYRAFVQEPEKVAQANVMVRMINLKGAPEALSLQITKSTNTQNRMEARDFIALDPQQELIREDFALSLGKSYIYRRGDFEPSPAAGCSVVEAATALACTHSDAALVARLRRDHDYLWRKAPDGAYTSLFGQRPSALQIWRSVRLLRTVSRSLEDLAPSVSPRGRSLARSGTLLISHIVFQIVGNDGIDEPGDEWEAQLESVLTLIPRLLSTLLRLTDATYGDHALISVTLSNEERCRGLAAELLRRLKDNADLLTPFEEQAPPSYRPRRPNSVPLLIDHQRIEDGSQLVYVPTSVAEEHAVEQWLNEDPKRFLATWVNDPRRPLIWAFDKARYSPSGLVSRIWEASEWAERPISVQGASRWLLPGEGTLLELATEIRISAAETDDGSSVA
ncbi:AIPR family protein [Kitasatospora sp. NPDC086801]|uniref:AIPR family protein n=1 Tax=Kitasatospora sp. NPDC086801 TaxID=3364066 RepID=UPI003803C9DD